MARRVLLVLMGKGSPCRRMASVSEVVPLFLLAWVVALIVAPSVAQASPPTTAFRYFYDAEGRLKAVYKPSNETALYTWDAAGNLLSIGRKSSSVLSITELAPTEGAVGETITIDGTGFSTTTGNDTVKFNGTAATVSAATAWALTVKVPTGATTGTVTVKTTTEGPVTSAQTFTVAASPAPQATSISPSISTAGSSVTISGSNFETAHTSNDAVAINGMRAPVTSATSTALHVTVPGVTLGGHTIVTTPYGTVTGPDLYIPPEGLAASKVGPTGRLTVGGSGATLNFTAAEKIGLGIFDGTVGERISVTTSELTIAGGELSIWSPAGKLLYSASLGAAEMEPLTLHTMGTYTVMVKPSGTDTGKVKLSAAAIHEVTGSITPTTEGSATHVVITTPYQKARYTVEVTANEVVSLASSESTLGAFPIEWLNSREEVVGREESYGSGEFIGATRFPTAGKYTLLVNPAGATTGSMVLTAYNASDATGSLTLGESKTFTVGVPGQIERVTFSASSGERLSVPVKEPSFSIGNVVLYNPEGVKVTEFEFNGEGFLEPITLSKTGTYTLVVTPGLDRTGSFKMGAYSVHEITGSITPTTEGALKHVVIETPGQNARYSVEVSANEVVSLATSESTLEATPFEWLNSAGEHVGETQESYSGSSYVGATRFPTTGTYTLVVNPRGPHTGSLMLKAYNASDATGTITPGGEAVKATVGVPGQIEKLTFTGTEGQLLTLNGTESTFAAGWFSVWNPEGVELSGSETSLATGEQNYEFTPAKTGAYTILVKGYEAATGSVKLKLYTGSHDDIVRPGKAFAAFQTLNGTPQGLAPSGTDPTGSPSTASLGGPRASAAMAAPLWRAGRPPVPWGRTHAAAHWPVASGRRRVAVRYAGATVAAATPALAVTRRMRAFRPLRPSSWEPSMGPLGRVEWQSLQPSTPWSGIAPLRAGSAVTALSGQVLGLDGLPLKDVRVAVEHTYIAGETDSTGRFLLSGLPAGHQVLVIEGETVPGHQRYGSYDYGLNLIAGQTTVLEQTVWLTPLNPAGDHSISSPNNREVTLRTPQIPGLEVRIPAGTVITDAAGHRVRKLNITAIPVDRTPFPLPPFVEVPTYFTVQPGRAYLSKPAEIIYPNYAHLAPGQRAPFWNYDPNGRGWYVYGQGTVSANGKQVIPDPGVRVWQFSGAMFTNSPTPPSKGPKGAAGGGDPVDLYTGLFDYHKTDLVLPDTIPIVIQRSYRQADSNSYSFGVGATNLYDIRMWSENNWHEADLILPEGGRVHYVRISPGEGYKEAEYKSTNTPGPYYDSTIKWNESERGWDLKLTNGLTFEFGEDAPLQAIRDRFGDQLTITRTEGENGNITQITSPHGRWVTFSYDGSNRITEIKDNAGGTLQYHYNSSGYLEKVTDPAGHETKYEYDSSGDMTAITDGRGNKYLENKYNSNDRVSKQIDGDGGTFEFSYALNGEGNAESATITDPRENKQKVTLTRKATRPAKRSASAPLLKGPHRSNGRPALGSSCPQLTHYLARPHTNTMPTATSHRSRSSPAPLRHRRRRTPMNREPTR